MAWYKTGSITCTNGATSVTGTGTRFAANARVGDGLRGLDGEWYEIVNIASETTLGIYPAYAGPTGTGTNYMIAPMQGYNKESADRLRGITDGLADIKDDVAAAEAAASEAETSAANAKASETIVANDAAEATASKNAALISQNAAKASETNAKTSETNAKASETAALASKNDAAASQTAAGTSATNAANSATAALASQNAAKTSETNAKTSETNAKASETTVAASATAAANSATTASTAATNATTANNAAQAAKTSAETFKGQAAASQTAALASENKAKAWADNAVDTPVETGKYSAKHWASKAADSAAQAGAAIGTRLNSIATAVMAVNDMLIADTTTTMKAIATGATGRSLLAAADAATAQTAIGATSVGKSLITAVDAAAGRTALALGTVATENVVPVSKGGTGGNTAAAARTGLELGTAATRNATTSTTDTTANSLLKVGDFGIGQLGSLTLSTAQLDSTTLPTGMYRFDPATGGYKGLVASAYSIWNNRLNDTVAVQIAVDYNNGKVYTRGRPADDFKEVYSAGALGGLGSTAMTTNITDFLSNANVTGPIKGAFATTANSPTTLNEGFGGWCTKYSDSVAFYTVISGTNKQWYGYKQSASTIVWTEVVGAGVYGYGGTQTNPPNNDANALSVSGQYATTSATVGSPGYTGGPVAGQQGYLNHYQHSNPAYATQEWFQLNSTVRRFTRAKHNGTWYDWVEVLTASNGVTLDGNDVIGGTKTFIGTQMRYKAATPGMWMEEGGTATGVWMVLNGGVMQFQHRATSFGGTAGTTPLSFNTSSATSRSGYQFTPATDNAAAMSLGASNFRWPVVYSATGAINTSDGREKTPVDSLSVNQINAAKQLSKEIGTYKWLTSVQEKGADARLHIGMTVQRAIEIMESNNLDPMAYGFICYDSWDAVPENSYVERRGYVYTLNEESEETVTVENVPEEGNAFPDTGVYWKYTHDEKVIIEEGSPAGDRYSFRYDELNLFIAAGLNANQEVLEARLAAIEAQLNA